MSSFFQNSEMIVPYHQVTHVMKYPPDRLEVGLVGQSDTLILLNDDCKVFLQGYTGWLQQ